MRAVASSVVIAAVSACGPSDVCRDYVACQVAVDDSVDVSAYDDGGSCWDLPSVARTCTAQCEEALRALQALAGAPDACFPDGREAALGTS